MRPSHYITLAIALLGPACDASAQVVIVSAPKEPSLLTVTREWSRASTLGDLREIHLDSSDIEVRAWGGYGLTSTQAMVLRRESGRWLTGVSLNPAILTQRPKLVRLSV